MRKRLNLGHEQPIWQGSAIQVLSGKRRKMKQNNNNNNNNNPLSSLLSSILVGEIIEKNIEEEKDFQKKKFHSSSSGQPPFLPPSEMSLGKKKKKKNNNNNSTSIKNDENYSNLLPSTKEVNTIITKEEKSISSFAEMLEKEKEKWMEPIIIASASKASSSSSLRFDFEGLLCGQGEKDFYSGLYHHGDDPLAAGYTIGELVHLSKSTVPSQRTMALLTLSRIVENLYSNTLGEESNAIKKDLHQSKSLFSARVALDALQETVMDAALNFLYIKLGSDHLLQIFDRVALLQTGNRHLPLDEESIAKMQGIEFDSIAISEERTMEEIMAAMERDSLGGLMLTNVVERLRWIFLSPTSNIAQKSKIIRIFTLIASRGVISCEEILAGDGIIEAFGDTIFKMNWPTVLDDRQQSGIIVDTLRLFRILCQSSRKATQAMSEYNIFEASVKFLSAFPSSQSTQFRLGCQIATQEFLLLNISFSYGLSASILDSFRSLLLDACRTLCSAASNPDVRDMKIVLMTIAAASRMLKSSLTIFRSALNAGGVNDALLPFAEIFIVLTRMVR
jgi:hypothetical protein